MKQIEELIKKGNATVIDVRSPGEFMGGHVANSINIPLNEISSRMEELKKYDNIILCCASGGRSSMAQAILGNAGIKCFDGGPWTNVNYLINN